MLTWISQQAKWVIYIFIFFILAGLLFMDMSQLQFQRNKAVGVVNGEAIDNDLFNQNLERMQRSQQEGERNLTDAQMAQMRRELFRSFVQRKLMEKQMQALQTQSSVWEMMRDLRDDPPPGIMQAPVFMTDSQFDRNKYEAWLSTDSIYDDPQMLAYESNLRDEKIPLKQMKVFVDAGFHPTSLEARFNASRRESRTTLWVASASIDSFPLAESAVSDDEVKAYFTAQPDSFYAVESQAQVFFAVGAINPSTKDTTYAREEAEKILEQLKEGSDFAELAQISSEDPGSAAQGGLLGDFQARGQWVKPFEDAAFALDSGAMSGLVQTPFGFHILKCEGKQPITKTDTVEKVKIRHILVRVFPGNETVDSIVTAIQAIKDAADKTGSVDKAKAEIEKVAKEHGLATGTSAWFARGETVPELGYIQGLASYAFGGAYSTGDEEELTSPVMQSKTHVAVALKIGELKAGERSLEKFTPAIRATLAQRKRGELAKAHLEKVLPQITAAPVIDSAFRASLPKVRVDSLSGISAESFVPGLGYASPVLAKLVAQAPGAWGTVQVADRAVAAAKVLSTEKPDAAALDAQIREELAASWRLGTQALFNEWIASIEAGAEVEDNLDLYFRE